MEGLLPTFAEHSHQRIMNADRRRRGALKALALLSSLIAFAAGGWLGANLLLRSPSPAPLFTEADLPAPSTSVQNGWAFFHRQARTHGRLSVAQGAPVSRSEGPLWWLRTPVGKLVLDGRGGEVVGLLRKADLERSDIINRRDALVSALRPWVWSNDAGQ